MNIETANRLLQYRKDSGLSQEELAEKIGVSRQAVSKWERSEASPDTDNLIRLAEVYGVSLDELLRGNTNSKTSSESTEKETESPEPEAEQGDEGTEYVKYDKVSFKNGIHVDSKNGDHVHISFKDGVNVYEKDGDKVHVSWDGVSVKENGKQRVYTDENGNIMVDEEIKKAHTKSRTHKAFEMFPFWAIAIAAFLAWGFSGLCFGWALSWIALFTIPLYYSLVSAVFRRDPRHFAYPVLVVGAYILFGYFNILGGWQMGWIVFLTIPVYYLICTLIKSNGEE